MKQNAMKPLKLEDIRALNVEVSAVCNARCPFCSRTQKHRPYGAHRITRSDFRLLPASFIAQLRRISFGGNFGDLCCNTEFTGIAADIRRLQPDITLEGDTNGSLQPPEWWQTLGACFQKGAMVFALDGLADTHGLHRRGTDFATVIRNLKAFVAGGGQAIWKFIVFKHNEHQIDAAERLAEAIGCLRFYAIASRDFNGELQPPETLDFTIKRQVFATWQEKLEAADRHAVCRPVGNRSLYIAADGTVHPCCFAHLMYITEHNENFRFIVPLVEKYYDRINFKTRPIADIVQGSYFAAVLKRSATNVYCMTKCNRLSKQARRQLVIRDRFF